MTEIFTMIFYQPLLNILIYIYNVLPVQDIGIAIIIFTVLIRLVLYPLTKNSLIAQKKLQEIQPKINELKKKYKGNKEEMAKQMMAIYKENNINPMSSCLPILVQLPFLIAIFLVFRDGVLSHNLELLYGFVSRPDHVNEIAFGFLNLAQPSVALAVLAGIAQYFATKMLSRKKPAIDAPASKDEELAAMMNKQMLYMMPVLTVLIGITLPGGLALYWLVTTLLMILQQYYMFHIAENNVKKIPS